MTVEAQRQRPGFGWLPAGALVVVLLGIGVGLWPDPPSTLQIDGGGRAGVPFLVAWSPEAPAAAGGTAGTTRTVWFSSGATFPAPWRDHAGNPPPRWRVLVVHPEFVPVRLTLESGHRGEATRVTPLHWQHRLGSGQRISPDDLETHLRLVRRLWLPGGQDLLDQRQRQRLFLLLTNLSQKTGCAGPGAPPDCTASGPETPQQGIKSHLDAIAAQWSLSVGTPALTTDAPRPVPAPRQARPGRESTRPPPL